MADDVFSQIHAEAQQPAGDVFAQIHAEQGAAPSLSSDDVQRLHQLYDSRPLWRKVMGSQPAGDSLSDSDKALLQRARDIGKTGAQQLTEGVVSGMVEGAKAGAKMAPFMALPALGALADTGGAAGAAANMATQAAGSALLTKAEGGSNEDAATSALFGGAGPAIAEGMPKLADALETSAAKNYRRVLNPTSEKTKFITNDIMPKVLQERPVAYSRSGLASQAAEQAEAAGQQIEQKTTTLAGTMQTKPIIDGLDNLKKSTMVRGVQLHPEAEAAIDAVKDQIQRMGTDIPYSDVIKARRVLDSIVSQAGGYTGKSLAEGSLTDVRRVAANAMRANLAGAHPDLAALNAQYHFWQSLSTVAEIAANKAPSTSQILDVGVPTLAMAAHNPAIVIPAIVGKTIKSPAWNMLNGAMKAKAAEALASGDVGQIVDYFSKIGAARQAQ